VNIVPGKCTMGHFFVFLDHGIFCLVVVIFAVVTNKSGLILGRKR